MSAALGRALIRAGLIQFGAFGPPDAPVPYRVELEMLPSYPALLRLVVAAVPPLLGPADYLVSTWDATPVAVALAIQFDRPLVYSRGGHAEPVHDLVGAYDIGHRAVLITTHYAGRDAARLESFAAGARRVGLDARRLVAIVDAGGPRPDGLDVAALVSLRELVASLVDSKALPEGQGRAVLDYSG